MDSCGSSSERLTPSTMAPRAGVRRETVMVMVAVMVEEKEFRRESVAIDPGMRLGHLERTLNDDPISDVLVAHGFLGEKQAFESNRFNRNTIELNRLGVLAQCIVSLPVGVQHDVHDEGICNPDVLAFFEPLRLDVFGRSIRQYHQGILDTPACLQCRRNNHIDIGRRTLITMGRKRVATDQQVFSAVRIERSQQQFEIFKSRGTAELIHFSIAQPPVGPYPPLSNPRRAGWRLRASESDRLLWARTCSSIAAKSSR